MRDYNREMSAHLRKIGVKIPITGTNWSTRLGVAAAQDEMDFNDSHVYWNYPWRDPVGDRHPQGDGRLCRERLCHLDP